MPKSQCHIKVKKARNYIVIQMKIHQLDIVSQTRTNPQIDTKI